MGVKILKNKNLTGKWISLIYRYGQNFIGQELKKLDIGSGQYIFITALYHKDGVNQEEISEYLKIDKGTTARAIKKLEEQGYIIRKEDDNDKRAYKVYLTDKALYVKPEICKAMKKWTNILSEGFDEEEKELTLSFLERMADNAARLSVPPKCTKDKSKYREGETDNEQ